MRKIITLLIGIFYLSTNLYSQHLDYDNNSRWFWGFNAGGTWHTTDVQTKTNFGLGLTLGRSFNYDYGKKVSFDVRGRLLYGDWVGIDRKRSDFTIANNALSSGETNYKDSLGYAFRNFSTSVTRLSLELVLHLNSLKERTGVDTYVFGGVGYSWFRAKGNYLNETDNGIEMYDYTSWDENLTKKEYKAMQDYTDETVLDGSSKFKRVAKVMPSLGLGIGYQFAPRFTAGLEHKTTFTGLDFFDGITDQSSLIKNDWYHYTSVYLRFYLKPAKGKRNNTTVHNNPTNNNAPDRNDQMQPPVVRFTSPFQPGTETTLASYTIRADIKNVYNKQDITFTHNGREITAFNFNSNNGKFDYQASIAEGENNFEITGRNVYGSDRATTNLIYRKPDPVPPIVNFQNPSISPRTVTSNVFEMEASVLHVDQKSQVTLLINGNVQSNFTYNSTTNKVRATLNLNLGTNVVQLTGTNAVGTDSKTTVLLFNRDYIAPNQTRQPPVVYFTNPGYSPTNVNATTISLDAKVLHVMNKQNITFKQNGQVNYNFNFNASNKDFRANVSLISGQNVFEIIGTNQDGSAQATTIVIYDRSANQPPIVTINTPSSNPYYADHDNLNFIASVLNVSSKNQVEVKINGQSTNNFTFNNSTVSANIRLASGTTVIDIKGTNSYGSDQKQTTIIYRKPTVQTPSVNPPTVYFVNPPSNPMSVNSSTFTLDAKVINVMNQQNVIFKQNGQTSSSFTFNPSSHDFRSVVSLNYGQNVFEIIGTNQDGSAQATTVLVFERSAKNPPIVTITTPTANPFNTDVASVYLTATVLNVSSKNQVEVKVNGQTTTNFAFNNSTVSGNFGVVNGTTVIEVKGTNQDGVDQKQTTINYRSTVAYTPKPPVVTIVTPASNPYSSSEPEVMFVSNVLNVSSANQVELKINGQLVNDFLFINSTVSKSFVLASGSNVIEIKATNQDGTDQKSTAVMFRKPTVSPTKRAPIVTITTPNVNPFSSTSEQLTFTATVLNVSSISQIEMKVNGEIYSNFTFNNSTVQANLSLGTSSTLIEIKATNQDGFDQKQTKVTYRKPFNPTLLLQKPIVTYRTPKTNPETTNDPTYYVLSNVKFVTEVSGIEVKVNGVKLTRVDFNTATGDLRFTVKLNEGTNTFVVTGTNTVGTDSKTTVVLFENKPTIDKPTIVYTNPARCPASFEQGAQSIKGVVSNVSSAQQVVFKIGGKEVTNALTEMKDGKLNFTIPILMGSVDLSIQTTATNSAGVEVKSCLVKPIKSTIKPATPIKTDGRNPTLNPNVVTPKDSGKVVPDQPVLVNPGRTPTVNPDNSGKGKPSRTGTVRPIP